MAFEGVQEAKKIPFEKIVIFCHLKVWHNRRNGFGMSSKIKKPISSFAIIEKMA